MTHRDELLSLQARVEAQAREIDEARSEIELLRAAHARKTREVEELRRALCGEAARGDGWAEREPAIARGARGDEGAYRRSFGLAAALIGGAALASTMLIAAGAGRPHRNPSRAPTPFVSAFERVGHVVSGDPAVADVGAECTVRREPVDEGAYDCRFEVRCGDRVLYGASPETGYVRCGSRLVVRDGNFTARDGDPAMEIDLVTGRVVVEEQLGLGTQRVEIALTPPATDDLTY